MKALYGARLVQFEDPLAIRNIGNIFYDAVRIWRDHNNGVLLTPQPLSTGTTCKL
jgi:hypothetical protein